MQWISQINDAWLFILFVLLECINYVVNTQYENIKLNVAVFTYLNKLSIITFYIRDIYNLVHEYYYY